MIAPHRRSGIALLTTLAVVSLVALLAVATLSVSTRLEQTSSLVVRDAKLDADASFGLASVIAEWRPRSLGAMGVGETRSFALAVPGRSGSTVSVTVSRVSGEIYWTVAQATSADGSARRQNLLLRRMVPRLDSLPPLQSSGDVSVSDRFFFVRDSAGGCAPLSPDVMMAPGASLTSRSGALPALRVGRSPTVTDSASTLRIGGVSVPALAARADLVLAGGTSGATPSGVVHATGDLTLTSGSGQGILIVDGHLTFAGPVSFVGLIIARDGIAQTASGARVTGALRAGPGGFGKSAAVQLSEDFTLIADVCIAQAVVADQVMPKPVAGRRWGEIF